MPKLLTFQIRSIEVAHKVSYLSGEEMRSFFSQVASILSVGRVQESLAEDEQKVLRELGKRLKAMVDDVELDWSRISAPKKAE